MKESHRHILETIRYLRESFDDSVKVYTEGSCVKLCMLLKHLYPEGMILYDMHHAVFELEGACFDINGFADKHGHIPIEQHGILHVYKIMNLKYTGRV